MKIIITISVEKAPFKTDGSPDSPQWMATEELTGISGEAKTQNGAIFECLKRLALIYGMLDDLPRP